MKYIYLLLVSLILPCSLVARAAVVTTPVTCEVVATQQSYPCAVGSTGIRVDKMEGDKATPAGDFVVRRVFYRADKLTPDEIKAVQNLQKKGFLVQALTQDDGWVDDVNSPYYNQYVKLSTLGTPLPSHENLWRDDDVYDIILALSYNDNPVVKGKGSAIFMHVARPDTTADGAPTYKPTVGCVALAKPDLLTVLNTLTPQTKIEIAEGRPVIQIR